MTKHIQYERISFKYNQIKVFSHVYNFSSLYSRPSCITIKTIHELSLSIPLGENGVIPRFNFCQSRSHL